MHQWLPENFKVGIKFTLAPYNFILRKELSANPDITLPRLGNTSCTKAKGL
jgi:hypothetical protein